MKYERKSPYADGFNDIYTTAGVDADDVWARKHLLLGGDGGDGGAGEADVNQAGLMAGFAPDDPNAPGPAGSFSSDQAAANDAAAEAAAQDAAQGEMDAYEAQLDVGLLGDMFNFVSPIDVTKTHDQFGRGVYGLDVSVPGVVGSVIGGPLGMAIGTLGPAVGRGLGIDTNVSIGPEGISTGMATPGAVESAVTDALGIDTSPGSFSAALSDPTDPGQTTGPSVSVSAPGVSTTSNETGMMAGFAPDPGYSPSGAVTSFAARGYRQGGAVNSGIGSLVSIR